MSRPVFRWILSFLAPGWTSSSRVVLAAGLIATLSGIALTAWLALVAQLFLASALLLWGLCQGACAVMLGSSAPAQGESRRRPGTLLLALPVPAALAALPWLFGVTTIDDDSARPSLEAGERVVYLHIAEREALTAGDLVAVACDRREGLAVMRVVALEDVRFVLEQGWPVIDGRPLPRSDMAAVVSDGPEWQFERLATEVNLPLFYPIVPPNEGDQVEHGGLEVPVASGLVALLPDNRRTVGRCLTSPVVPRVRVEGRVLHVLWSPRPGRIGLKP